MRYRYYIILVVMIFFNSLGYAGTETTATGEGRSKDDAIQVALRRAVEQGVGVFIKSKTEVENFQVIEDKVFSRAKGYVSKYDVIKSTKENEEWSVTIKAIDDAGLLKDD